MSSTTSTGASRRTSSATLSALGLLAVTAAWGSTFFLLKGVVDRVPVTDFLAVRFALATVAVALIAPRAVAALTPAERRHGVVLGLVYGGAQILQTVGLQTTSASVSGFVTGMYVVFTPLLAALLLRARIGRTVWSAVALATAGLAVLSLQGLSIGGGEALTLASALLYGAHIVGLGAWSSGRNALGLTVVQLATITVVCGAGAVPGGLTVPDQAGDWGALIYMALVAGALALVVQTWAQAHLPATRAAIIMTMEPVFAGLFAVLLGGERLGPRVVLGGALVLGAMYLVELGPRRPDDQDVAAEVGGVTHVGPV
ncbi:MAG: Threonine/homoserine efflux transporter RhtA [Frankiales bacterium]|nr:Threonine/homoserine efflux transporter RhtA [Frankiales bacterium]